MNKEAERWLRQAEVDLEASKWNIRGEFFENACFLAQQSAEKALKAVLYETGLRMILGHSTFVLAKKCAEKYKKFSEILPLCAALDKYYVTSRYPDSIPGGIPHEIYSKEEAETATSNAEKIMAQVKAILK